MNHEIIGADKNVARLEDIRIQNLRELMLRWVNEYKDNIAYCLYDGEQVRNVTFQEFATDVLKVCRYYIDHGMKQAHIAMMASNSYQWLVIYFAALLTDNVCVLVNQGLDVTERIRQCTFADVTHVYADIPLDDFILDGKKPIALTYAEMTAGEPADTSEIEALDEETLCTIFFTSGTLGLSKAVMISHKNVIARMYQDIKNFPVTRTFIVLPFYHTAGLSIAMRLVVRGGMACLGRGIRYMFQDMKHLQAASFIMVPAIMEGFAKFLKSLPSPDVWPAFIGPNMKHLLVCGALPKKETNQFFTDHGFLTGTVYGLTETMGCGTTGLFDNHVVEGIGKPGVGTQLRIEDGELLISGPFVMKGYYKDPEATAQAIRDGWLYTGDLARVDEDGWYFITGRKKNVILLSNGENISPEDVEATLMECDAVIECMVYSIPKGICADIVTQNPEAAAAHVKAYNQRNPIYKQIFKANYLSEPLPKTGSGKIKRKANQYE